MFYVFPYTITTSDVEAAKHEETLRLTQGVIHQVDVLFEDGCNHAAHVMIFNGDFQVWPSNRGQTIRGNATVVSFREFYEIDSGAATLKAFMWGDGVIDGVEVVVQIGLLPKKIIQPMSFEELLAAAAGIP